MKAFIPLDPDLNNDGKVTIDELFRSTMLIYGLLVGAVSAVLWGIWVAVAGKIPQPLTFLRVQGAIVALLVPVAAFIGVRRLLRIERQEGRDKTMWDLEYKRAQWEFNQARGVSEDARATTLAQAEIDAAALTILQRYYAGKPCTRDACTDAGLMTAQLWNEANALLKKRGIRRGRKSEFVPDDFAAAWARYCEHKLRANQHKVANGEWTEAR